MKHNITFFFFFFFKSVTLESVFGGVFQGGRPVLHTASWIGEAWRWNSFCSFQLSTILELLEGSFYGMDLLKLHSVTNKLLDRMERIEKVQSGCCPLRVVVPYVHKAGGRSRSSLRCSHLSDLTSRGVNNGRWGVFTKRWEHTIEWKQGQAHYLTKHWTKCYCLVEKRDHLKLDDSSSCSKPWNACGVARNKVFVPAHHQSWFWLQAGAIKPTSDSHTHWEYQSPDQKWKHLDEWTVPASTTKQQYTK